jgi:predicted N-formylglutamate amidohydrolase
LEEAERREEEGKAENKDNEVESRDEEKEEQRQEGQEVMTRTRGSAQSLLLTCEHGGNRIPDAYAALFRGAEDVLASHRGWDLGALTLARLLARKLDRPLLAVTWSRLFVEANRAPTNRRIWSKFTKDLPKAERDGILARWWRPHRQAVEDAVAADIARGQHVVHVAVHSFTPELDGVVRNADIGFLYDSRRKREADLCRRWAAILRRLDPSLRVRYNYPYGGAADGLTTWMRRRHPQTRYLGVELEINQALVGTKAWQRFQDDVAASLRELLSPS